VLLFCYEIDIVSEASQPAAVSTPGNSFCLSSDLLEQLKAQLPESLFASVSGAIAGYEKQFDTKSNELQYARLKIQLLEEKLRLQRIAKYGPGSEKLSNLQLELLEFEPGVSNTEVVAESERNALPPTPEKKKRRKHPGRQTLPADLPRVERVIACTPEQCVCGNCGADTKVIGYEVSEVLDVKPAEYFVEVTKREKRACKKCEEQGVAMAPLPVRIIAKSLVSDRIIIDTIVGKYADHNPLYRQSVIFLRDAGIDISRATMCGWVMTVGEMLAPVVGAMRCELLAGSYIQADETTVDVQMHDRRGKNHQGYLWQYGTPGGATIFDFQMSRGREGPAHFLNKFEGILQTDGYVSYVRGVGGPKMVHAACWSHARRGFVDAIKLNKLDAASINIVELMDQLFAIDDLPVPGGGVGGVDVGAGAVVGQPVDGRAIGQMDEPAVLLQHVVISIARRKARPDADHGGKANIVKLLVHGGRIGPVLGIEVHLPHFRVVEPIDHHTHRPPRSS
jgi:transposase